MNQHLPEYVEPCFASVVVIPTSSLNRCTEQGLKDQYRPVYIRTARFICVKLRDEASKHRPKFIHAIE